MFVATAVRQGSSARRLLSLLARASLCLIRHTRDCAIPRDDTRASMSLKTRRTSRRWPPGKRARSHLFLSFLASRITAQHAAEVQRERERREEQAKMWTARNRAAHSWRTAPSHWAPYTRRRDASQGRRDTAVPRDDAPRLQTRDETRRDASAIAVRSCLLIRGSWSDRSCAVSI